jgi:uncharacterized protein YpiB (UPF0302 family)
MSFNKNRLRQSKTSLIINYIKQSYIIIKESEFVDSSQSVGVSFDRTLPVWRAAALERECGL